MKTNPALAANAQYLEDNYEAWRNDPNSVPADLAHFFEGFDFAQSLNGAGLAGKQKQSLVDALIYNYRTFGHLVAQVNPLEAKPPAHLELELSNFGLTEEDLGKVFDSSQIPTFREAALSQIVSHLRDTYCGPIGVEYMHIQDMSERRWLQERMEGTRNQPNYTHEQHRHILWKLQKAEMFEHYLQSTYRGQKRFSLEGSETLIPALDRLIERAPGAGIVEIVFGMTHRGRLNVLANIIEKSYDEIFSEFEDNFQMDTAHGDGDVKYHKGYSKDVQTTTGETVHLSLTANPSHLEMVGAVAEGKVRAKQALRGDKLRKKVIPVIIHGDAAFCGQGVVAETFNLSQLKGYRTGGTIHFIVNNQVGFTTTAQDYLSGLYCTDVAKMMAIPIFHVNGDRPEHVLHVMDIALDYRQKFGRDVVVDMWCYRRLGHNESDEPSFTQPLLYDKIAKHLTVDDIYAADLESRGEKAKDETEAMMVQFEARLEAARKQASEGPRRREDDDMLGGYWRRLQREYSHEPVDTGVSEKTLQHIAKTVGSIPPDFDVHRTVRKLMEDFSAAVHSGGQIKWAGAEILAFGSLLMEGNGVRLSGEDSRRGTFSQRHAVLYDQKTGEKYIPLKLLDPKQPEFCCYDSSLAELSVLAFDYGYSVGDPSRLILWEAQFGDFANGAQVIIDQFIAPGESKWGRMSGLVMLLPHGYEGQGPEHSNAWLRRYLSLCAEENIQVVNPSTPAQYFHVLRRQMRRNFRRPLIVMTPKSGLRHPRVVSPVSDFTQGHFREIIDDPREISSPRRVLFCSGKVYYDLVQKAEDSGVDDVAIVRVEQLYPFNEAAWDEISEKYVSAPEWAWVSEEPTNFGAWSFMHAALATYCESDIWFIGRARSASPATASLSLHKRQQQLIVDFALQEGSLSAELVDGVGVFTRGVETWHMKSRSPHSGNLLAKAQSPSG